MALEARAVKDQVAGLCRAHGYKLISFRRRKDGNYMIVLRWDPTYVGRGRIYQQIELVAPLSRAYATVFHYIDGGNTNVVFMGKR